MTNNVESFSRKIDSGQRIKLNVSGRIFETTYGTCCKSKYLKQFILNWKHDDVIFLDNSPIVFKHVLSYMQNTNYPFPEEYEYELDYFEISYKKIEKESEPESNPLVDKLTENHNEIMEFLKNDLYSAVKSTKECSSCRTLIDKDANSDYCTECQRSRNRNDCWLETHLVNIQDVGWIPSSKVQKGQYILTGNNTYAQILNVGHRHVDHKKMVTINNITLTHGHPAFVDDTWHRARHFGSIFIARDINYMNFVLESQHDIVLKNENTGDTLTVATIGKFPQDW